MAAAQRVWRWGILGTGGIASLFAHGLRFVPGARLEAVGSRSTQGAERFGRRFEVPRRHASYQALVADHRVDVVYVATPHPLHLPNALLALDAGKPVLVEKPFTMSAGEAAELIGRARERRLFLMEAMWARFLPAARRVRELLDAGALGEPRMLHADFGFRGPADPRGRLLDPALGGGSLLDVGVYTVWLACFVFGREPREVTGLAHRGAAGVDEQAAFLLAYEGGELACLSSAVRTATPQEASIAGTEGLLRLHAPFWRARSLTLARHPTRPEEPPGPGLAETLERRLRGLAGRSPVVARLQARFGRRLQGWTRWLREERIPTPYRGNGYNYEARHVQECLEAGRQESPLLPLDDSLAVMRTLDRVRACLDLRYPGE